MYRSAYSYSSSAVFRRQPYRIAPRRWFPAIYMGLTATTPETDLEGYWKLDNTHGANYRDDYTGNTNTLTAGTINVITAAKQNGGVNFVAGDSDFLSAPNHTTLRKLHHIALWVRFTTISADMGIVSKSDDATDANSSVKLYYDQSAAALKFTVGNGTTSATVASSGVTIAAATWYHLQAWGDFAAATPKLYIMIDGVLRGTQAASVVSPLTENGLFYLGRLFGGSYLNGDIDEVAVFSSKRTGAERQTLYNGGDGSQPPWSDIMVGPDGSADRYHRPKPCSFAEADNGALFVARGDRPLKKWDGLKTDFVDAGVPNPTQALTMTASGNGQLYGEIYAYQRWLDADSKVSNLSVISNVFKPFGGSGDITAATNATPIVVTSTAHGLSTGDTVEILGQLGNVSTNGTWTITKVDANSFQLDNSEGNGEWTGQLAGKVSVTTATSGSAVQNEKQTITVTGGSSLATDLKAHWKHNETSGNRTDEVASHVLLDNATVTSATGKLGNASQHTRANSEYFNLADHADVSTGDIDWSQGVWVYLDSKPGGDMGILHKGTQTSVSLEFDLRWDQSDDKFTFQISPDGSGSGTTTVQSSVSVSTGSWYGIMIVHDAAANLIKISVNGETFVTASFSGGAPDGAGDYEVGRDQLTANYFDGRIDSNSVWKRALSQDDTTDWYNSGNAVDYPYPGLGDENVTITYAGQSTATIASNATASTVQAALRLLSNVAPDGMTCTGGPWNTAAIIVEFVNGLRETDVNAMTAVVTGEMTAVVATTQEGSSGANEIQVISTTGNPSRGTHTLTLDANTTDSIDWDATAAEVQTELEALSTISVGDVACSGGPFPSVPITITFKGNLANTNISEMTSTLESTWFGGGGWLSGQKTIAYANIEVPTDTRVAKRQIIRNKPGSDDIFFVDIETEDLTSTTLSSSNRDDDLGDEVALRDANGADLNVIRHGEPPNYKCVVAQYRNRLWMVVDRKYREGTLAFVNATDPTSGVDTWWPTVFNGRTVFPQMATAGNESAYEISAIDVSDQNLTFTGNYGGGVTDRHSKYSLQPIESEGLTIYHSENGLPESFNLSNGLTITREPKIGDLVTMFPVGGLLFIVFENRIYRYNYSSNPAASPTGDGEVYPVYWRGCVNDRCWVEAEGDIYLMDRKGVFAFSGSGIDPVSRTIQPMFSGETRWGIDWRNAQYFHAVHYPDQEVIKWFVTIGAGRYPRHAICYHYRNQRWWPEEYPFPITSSCLGRMGDRRQVFLGSTGRRIFADSGSALDVVSPTAPGTLRGTATAGALLTLTDSAAAFAATAVDAPIQITEGRGKGQIRLIVAQTATVLTISQPWMIVPDATSIYQIGGLRWKYRSGKFLFVNTGRQETRGVEIVFDPVDTADLLLARNYQDASSSAIVQGRTITSAEGDGVAREKDSADFLVDATESSGHAQYNIDGYREVRTKGARRFMVELEGVPNKVRQKVLELDIHGVQ